MHKGRVIVTPSEHLLSHPCLPPPPPNGQSHADADADAGAVAHGAPVAVLALPPSLSSSWPSGALDLKFIEPKFDWVDYTTLSLGTPDPPAKKTD